MPKVLAIQGSPRQSGNTEILLRKVLEGAESAGAETGFLALAGLRIGQCDGCQVCWEGEDCVLQDDMNALYPKLIESDALVFGTPVYWYGPTAIMKALIDRLVYFNGSENRARIRDKPAALVVPFEEESDDTAAPLLAMFEKSFAWLELVFVGALLAPGMGEKGAILRKPERLQAAFELGLALARRGCMA